MKPALTWTIALGGLLLLAGAMAWATRSLVGMERTQNRMAGEAAVQERSRLALWRMESLAASLLVGESARPPDQYRTSPASAPPVSPAGPVLLHFEMDPDGRVRSPQVTDGPDKPPVPDESALRLQELRARLAEKAGPEQWAMLGLSQHTRRVSDNRSWLAAANLMAEPLPAVALRDAAAGLSKNDAVRALEEKDQPTAIPPAPAPASDYAPPQLNVALKPSEARQEQDSSNKKEADMRQRVVGDLARAPQRRQVEEKLKASQYAESPAPAPAAVSVAKAGADAADQSIADRPSLPAGAAPAAIAQTPADEIPALEAVLAEREAQRPLATVSDFRALWIKDALLLTRRVSLDGANSIQGAWVDWPQLRASLLAAISDLFPAASLEPAPASTSGGSDLLAALPIRFLPGRLEIPAPPFWSPLKLSLATAWGCVLLASVAVALVLRGMMLLSERRAAFVSAVTHELRTPLATFKLYSEMLADGLVKDPAKRQSYLETLTTEADRLGHLVENVLSYSRLERGKGAEGQIPVILRDLLHRVEPRLHQRVSQAGAEFSIHHETIPDDFALTTDPAAVEQILFNLVDNACKYAVRDGIPAQLELVLTPASAALQFALRDHGPGLTPAEARKLFRPFHKSARDAAHSAPGVGLGLALCRRLARDLGGTLEIDHSWPHGACFVLTLPVPA
ncbi:MAG: HAMP domain-containing sensor histidine kinase [Verrucomicrobiota bacterium]